MDCWQVWGGAFTPNQQKTGVTKLVFIYVKRAKAQHIVPWGFGTSKLLRGFTPDSNPKRGSKNVTIILSESMCHSPPYRVKAFGWQPQNGLLHCKRTKVKIVLASPVDSRYLKLETATQKGVIKRGNKIDMCFM